MRSLEPVSLFGRLLLGFAVVMVAIWICALAYVVVRARADQLHDSAIVNKGWARQTLLNIVSVPGQPDDEVRRIGGAVERLRLDMFAELGIQPKARTQIWKGRRLVYRSDPRFEAAFPPIAGAAGDGGAGWTAWVERDAASGITIWRSQKIDENWMFSPSAVKHMLMPLAYSLPFLLLPAWFIVRGGLRPLRHMGAAIAARSAADLAPLPPSPYRELAPLTGAINLLMKRLAERLAREQEFLSDAAHELKTPLAVIQLNAHLLEADSAASARAREAGAGLRAGVARASHTVHQLLAFERTRAGQGEVANGLTDLLGLLRERLALAVPLAGARGIEIELSADRMVVLPLHRESMAALLDNVIGNAVKYSPEGGRVRAELTAGARGPRLFILDQGRGIAPALRRKVFERFYRVPGQLEDGSGLGLAIAERAAARNGATILIEDGEDGVGTLVTIGFGA